MGYGGLSLLINVQSSNQIDDYAAMEGAVSATGAASPAAKSSGKL